MRAAPFLLTLAAIACGYATAMVAAAAIAERVELTAYRCPTRNLWHLTKTRAERARHAAAQASAPPPRGSKKDRLRRTGRRRQMARRLPGRRIQRGDEDDDLGGDGPRSQPKS